MTAATANLLKGGNHDTEILLCMLPHPLFFLASSMSPKKLNQTDGRGSSREALILMFYVTAKAVLFQTKSSRRHKTSPSSASVMDVSVHS